jgi:hypothetical protein
MLSEHEIRETLNSLVEDFLQNSSFFIFWASKGVTPSRCERFLVSFDYLVKSFPPLIAAGAYRVKDEAARAVLAVNLHQECGEGDVQRTHHAIYRKFLATSGIPIPLFLEDPFAQE